MTKAPDAFRTISEVADDLDLPQHVLRFWETKFSQIKPMKRGGGRRYYRPDDVDLLRGIRFLLYDEGYTIRGLQRILKEQGPKFVSDIGRGDFNPGDLMRPETDAEDKDPPARPVQVDEKPARSGPRKEAVPVSDLTGPQKPKRILDKIRGREAAPVENTGGGRGLSAEDRRDLQATLYELLECKRLLDQVRGS